MNMLKFLEVSYLSRYFLSMTYWEQIILSKFFLVCLLMLSANAIAVEYPTMDEFFANPAHQKRFDQIKVSDMYDATSKGCLIEAKTEIDKKQCECISDVVKSIDPKEIFYESYMEYQLFTDLVQSQIDGDSVKASEISAFKEQRNGLSKKLELACPKN
jgi:hypothetical protein